MACFDILSCRFEVICHQLAGRTRPPRKAHTRWKEKAGHCGAGSTVRSASSFPMCSYALCRWSSAGVLAVSTFRAQQRGTAPRRPSPPPGLQPRTTGCTEFKRVQGLGQQLSRDAIKVKAGAKCGRRAV